ncbi:hypothetical protein G6F46_010011 [Rhizopus delemar]|uniref:Uncharacterized protein n=2 Tax=Rhizopus TaxID=4842 RepID=A0A9P7CL64_9FUNG|nr:hypothetical protein G6F36_014690 [Rhizopus arrhizus]KAG1452934.1 hypothetical protein G6F55_008406 [Rhizopus delemar]KAG1492101.1 hypothetical protein G6F54_009548 [Rhizopus delemar]KAG1508279.1 hypothetical protein G6F53_008315 [Rhizopus delemar]KAG1521405.1 hypothetical protein G6F52_006774 [Rhizopus delemar]
MVHHPVNTIKVCSAKQEERKVWCEEQDFEDEYAIFNKKLSFFLMKYVSTRSSKLCRNDSDIPIVLSRKSPLVISDMCNTQKALGWNTNGVARDPLVRGFLEILEKEKVKHKRINHEAEAKSR